MSNQVSNRGSYIPPHKREVGANNIHRGNTPGRGPRANNSYKQLSINPKPLHSRNAKQKIFNESNLTTTLNDCRSHQRLSNLFNLYYDKVIFNDIHLSVCWKKLVGFACQKRAKIDLKYINPINEIVVARIHDFNGWGLACVVCNATRLLLISKERFKDYLIQPALYVLESAFRQIVFRNNTRNKLGDFKSQSFSLSLIYTDKALQYAKEKYNANLARLAASALEVILMEIVRRDARTLKLEDVDLALVNAVKYANTASSSKLGTLAKNVQQIVADEKKTSKVDSKRRTIVVPKPPSYSTNSSYNAPESSKSNRGTLHTRKPRISHRKMSKGSMHRQLTKTKGVSINMRNSFSLLEVDPLPKMKPKSSRARPKKSASVSARPTKSIISSLVQILTKFISKNVLHVALLLTMAILVYYNIYKEAQSDSV